MEILASTQGLTDSQKQAASALGVPANRILVKVKRIGMCFRC
jgi:xanthine dehydrogenase molybdopterin-binding subunit B